MQRLKLIRSRFWRYDQTFNTRKFLESCYSYLRDAKIGESYFSQFLDTECTKADINPRVLLVLMDMAYGGLRRREQPSEEIEKWCLGQLTSGKGLKNQVLGMLTTLKRGYIEGSNSEPLILKSGSAEILASNPETYALVSILWGCNIEKDVSKFRNLYETYFFKRHRKMNGRQTHTGVKDRAR